MKTEKKLKNCMNDFVIVYIETNKKGICFVYLGTPKNARLERQNSVILTILGVLLVLADTPVRVGRECVFGSSF